MSAEWRRECRGKAIVPTSSLLHEDYPSADPFPFFQAAWYTRRATVAAIYTAAGTSLFFFDPYLRYGVRDMNLLMSFFCDHGFLELHQLYSPATAHEFLDRLLDESRTLGTALNETGIYAKYIVDAWKGIIRSRGILF